MLYRGKATSEQRTAFAASARLHQPLVPAENFPNLEDAETDPASAPQSTLYYAQSIWIFSIASKWNPNSSL